MEGSLIHIVDFHAVLRLHLLKTNQIIARRFPQDNIAYAVNDFEFIVPIREIIRQGKTELFVLLSGQIEPSDRFFRVRITPELLAEEKRPHNSVRG